MKIKFIQHNTQRYDTAGDYVLKNKEWYFYISKLSKRRYEWLVTLHEIIECYLCYWKGIKEENIYKFDIKFEKERDYGIWKLEEPGDDVRAPYYKEHQIATFFEKIFAKILLVNWKKYEEEFYKLEYK